MTTIDEYFKDKNKVELMCPSGVDAEAIIDIEIKPAFGTVSIYGAPYNKSAPVAIEGSQKDVRIPTNHNEVFCEASSDVQEFTIISKGYYDVDLKRAMIFKKPKVLKERPAYGGLHQ